MKRVLMRIDDTRISSKVIISYVAIIDVCVFCVLSGVLR